MPKLFISYKRKTDGVEKLKRDLRAARYALWFDRDDIHLGDPDWQAKIEQGLRECAGMVLCLTPAACESDPIRFEVRKAIEFGKPIFPVMLEAVSLPDDLVKIGLSERWHVEPLTDKDTWDEQFDKLLEGLRERNIRVTTHDLRRQRGEKQYRLHQDYLAKLIRQVGRLQLSAIHPDHTQAEGAPLEAIYVPLPTKLTLSVEIEDYRIKPDWWVGERSQEWWWRLFGFGAAKREDYPAERRTRPAGWTDSAALESLVDAAQIRLDEEREQARAAREKKESYYREVKDGVYPDYIALDAHDVAAACPRLVVLGGPGSGKSVFARHLALCLAGAQRENWTRAVDLSHLGGWPHAALTPLYVELRSFIGTMLAADVTTPPTADTFWDYVQQHILGAELADYADSLREDLAEGRALIILDGLDEVPYPRGKGNLQKRQEQLKALARALDDAFGLTRILVTSRPYAYEGWTLPGFSAVELAPFEDRQRLQLAGNLYRAAGDDETTAQARAERLNKELRDKNISRELTDTPLFITLMATVFASGGAEGLPARKGALYRESILLLLERWTKAKPGTPTLAELLGDATRDDLLARLGALAYDVHERFGEQDGTPDIPRELLAKHIFEMEMDDPSVKAAQLVAYLSENAGVLVSPGHQADGHAFRFAHRTFQEYLAARHIVACCAESYAPVREHIESRPQVWRLPCLLSGDVLRDNENTRDAYDDLWALVETLSADDPPDGLPADEPRWWSSWLAAEIALEQELHRQDVSRQRSKRAVKDGLVAWLVKLTETPQALAPVDRAACGRALAALGDPRPGVGVVRLPSPSAEGAVGRGAGGEGILLPDIAWVEIPAGAFQMGGDPDALNAWEGGRFDIPYTFWMAKYPVTYAQYEAFVADDGYLNQNYWTAAGWKDKGDRREPYLWNDPKWHIGSHPVVGVTWYEAYAYTRWLTARYTRAGLKPTPTEGAWEIRLPTEAEWEKAARGTEGLIYPYGNEFDPAKGNTTETGIGQTSAVGLFPDGASLYGVLDMSGNVWEWCLTAWAAEYQHPGANDPEGSAARVLRGGSWNGSLNSARAASRRSRYPSFRDLNFGFRVVLGGVPS